MLKLEWCYEDEYCSKCFITCPQDKITLPQLLTRLYCWMVECEWQWFNRFDEWLCENYQDRLPHWWSY